MAHPPEAGVRQLVSDLRAINPESGVAAVLRTVAESARAAVGARFAAIVPTSGSAADGLITVAMDGFQDLPVFDEKGLLRLPDHARSQGREVELDGRSLVRVPIDVDDREFCVLYLVDPVDEDGFEFGSSTWIDDIAAVAGLAVQHAIFYEEHPHPDHWPSALDLINSDRNGPRTSEFFQEIAQTAMRLSHTECAAVATATGSFIEVRAAAGDHAERLRGSLVPSRLSLMGQVIGSLKYDVVEDASESARTYTPLSRAIDLGPAIVVPLQLDGAPIGSLLLGNHRGGDPVEVNRIVKLLHDDARLGLVMGVDSEESMDRAAPLLALRGTPSWDSRFDFLTRRELIVLGLLGDGLTNHAIAERLYLSEKTVRNYVSNTLTKLGMRRVEAAVHAARLLSLIEA